jgi:NAD kinase
MLPYNSLTYYDVFSYERNKSLRDFLKKTYVTELLTEVKQQCILVLWWDGTMLRAIWEHADKEIPFLWINFGHKGFLLNHLNWIFPNTTNFKSRKYPLLDLYKQWEKLWNAFNDIHIYSPEWKAISLDVHNWFWKLELWWDGMILASPAGSTGHSESYGGPILPHKSENLVITPKWNITPQSPKALDDEESIFISNAGRKYPLAINIDWEQVYISEIDEEVSLEVRKSAQSVKLLISENHLQDWDNKVLQEQGFSI